LRERQKKIAQYKFGYNKKEETQNPDGSAAASTLTKEKFTINTK